MKKNYIYKNLLKTFSNENVILYKSLSYHWNVEGYNFLSLHQFLKEIYENFFENLDEMAEKIRQCGFYIPNDLNKILKISDLKFKDKNLSQEEICVDMIYSFKIQYKRYYILFKLLEKENNQEFMDFLTERMASVKKFIWMFNSILKKQNVNNKVL